MKKNNGIKSSVVAMIIFASGWTYSSSFAAYEGKMNNKNNQGQHQNKDMQRNEMDFDLSNLPELTEYDKERLIYGQQEERLARDVYKELYSIYQIEVFNNINSSEDKHTSSIGVALEAYNMAETEGYGELSAKYDEWVAKGKISLKDAIEVGIAIEILDIEDLDATIANTENEFLNKIYSNLRRGSINHLKAFVRTLQQNNFETDLEWKKYLTEEELANQGEHKGNTIEGKIEHNNGENNQGEGRKNAKKGKNYKKFDGEIKEKKQFRDESKIKNKEAVEFLQRRGIIDGYGDGSFGPQNNITRAEALKVILEALGETPELVNVSEFDDVSTNAWYSGYVHVAKKKGIVNGYGDGTFGPNKTVSQVELLKIALESFGIDVSNYTVSNLPDGIATDQWFSVYLQYSIDTGILDVEDVNPNKGMTREKFSEVVYRLIEQQENL